MSKGNQKHREIIHTNEEYFCPYTRYGEPVPGMHWIPTSRSIANGEYESFLLKMEPGSTSKPHEHLGIEEFLMIEGTLIDNDEVEFNKGDFVRFQPGSKHSSYTVYGCILFVMLRGGTNRALSEDELAR